MTHTFSTSRGELLIREAGPADVAAFRELRLEALQDSPIAFSADYQKNLQQPLKHWVEILTMHADESTIFLAEADKKLIATAGVGRGGSPKTRHSAWIWGVYVTPEWRSLRIAEELIRSCFVWAKARRIVIAKLGVAAVNKSAVRCYERCGFTVNGTEPQALYYEGKYYDFYMMSCSLEDSL